MNSFQGIVSNLCPQVRRAQMEDREYLVVPMVMITEGVFNGSQGPLYYPPDELKKTIQSWNHKPVVVYHPVKNGVGVSACDPDVLSSRKVGVVLNTEYVDGKLKAEAWLEESRLQKIDSRILDNLNKGALTEVSTGLFTDNEVVTNGSWKGTPYVGVARNYRPDHLAILPDQKGACSIEHGGGLLRNEEAKIELKSIIREEMVLIENKRRSDMSKELLVENLIKGSTWVESDREFLMGLDEVKLNKMTPVKNEEKEKKEKKPPFIKNKKMAEEKDEDEDEEEKEKPPFIKNEVTVEEYVANAPEGIQDMLKSGLAAHQAEKSKLISAIVANKANVFQKAFLASKGMEELKGLAKLAAVKPTMNFEGLAEVPVETSEEALVAPTMNFGK